MSGNTPDVGNVGITSSGAIAAATTTTSAIGWINENAVIIGVALSLISLMIGVGFKIQAGRRAERHHKDRLIEEAKHHAEALTILRREIKNDLDAYINSKH